jgi:cytochrome c-type biogenesis protein CcmH
MADSKTPARRIAPATIALVLAGLLALAALVVAVTRSGDDGAQPAAAAAAPGGAAASIEQMITSLRQRIAGDPDNAEAWFLLGMAYRDTEQVQQAAQAFRRAMELQPDNVMHVAYLAESQLLLGTEAGLAEARRLLDRAAAIDAREPMVRFYRATLKDRDGDPRGAVDELIALVRDAPAGSGWEPQVRDAATAIARQHGIDIAGRLPEPRPAASTATAAIPGPTREQMAAASSIPPGQQNEMVKGMVDRLAARLQSNPRDAEGWVRLMRSRMVLGERDAAGAALRSGLAAFNDDSSTQGQLRSAARDLGVPGA